MKQLEFGFKSKINIGKVLDPQPPRYSECWETNCDTNPGTFDFYMGSDMEGHYLVHTVKTNNLNIEPQQNEKGVWVWEKISEKTKYTRDWYKKNK